MAVEFASDDWAKQFKEEVNKSNVYKSAAKGWKWTVGLVVEAEPDKNFPESRGVVMDLNDVVYTTRCALEIRPSPRAEGSERFAGLGMRTGIPLNGEAEGRVMNDDYMMRVYKRHMYNGDVANLSIGQGDTLITPLQMAQAMGAAEQLDAQAAGRVGRRGACNGASSDGDAAKARGR